LVNTGLAAAAAWPQVRALFADPYFAVRLEVVRGTYLLGVEAAEAIPLLRQFLSDESGIVRDYAKWALEQRYGLPVESNEDAEPS
jgi:HEAT repeat protein